MRHVHVSLLLEMNVKDANHLSIRHSAQMRDKWEEGQLKGTMEDHRNRWESMAKILRK